MKKAIITGISGQDGAYLAKALIDEGYEVYGADRRSSERSSWRLNYLGILDKVKLLELELSEYSQISNLIINRAGWQSGYAAACKAVYAGSIPASASNLIKGKPE